jgi:hypothetical protein
MRSSQNTYSTHSGEQRYKKGPWVERRASIVALDDIRYISLYSGCSIVLRLTKKGACSICR